MRGVYYEYFCTKGDRFGAALGFPGNTARRVTNMRQFNEDADLIFVPLVMQNRDDVHTAITPGTGVWYLKDDLAVLLMGIGKYLITLASD